MLKYIVKRIISLIPVVFIISVILFGMVRAMPGDPVALMMPQDGELLQKPEAYQRIYNETKIRLGLDKPLPIQYVVWVQNTLQGELGISTSRNRPVIDVVSQPLLNSMILNFFTVIISFVISLIIGIKSAVRQGKFYDRLMAVFSMIGYSLPSFFIAMILIFIFAMKLGWFPSGGIPQSIMIEQRGMATYLLQWARHLVLPVTTLMIGSIASTSRYVRNAMIEALSQDYIRTARSKGVSQHDVIYKHAFRNALIPVVTVVAWSIAGMFGGAAITERMFAFNGIGSYLIAAVLARDYNLVLAMNMFYTLLSLSANIFMDVGYALVDPRIRLS